MMTTWLFKQPRLVPIGVGVIVIGMLFFPVRNTILLTMDYIHLTDKISAMGPLTRVEKQNNFQEDLLLKHDVTKIVFGVLSNSCHDHAVVIKQVDLPKSVILNGIKIESLQVSLEGRFVNILQSLQDLSTRVEPVKICSLQFLREDDNREVKLVANIVFQLAELDSENGEK